MAWTKIPKENHPIFLAALPKVPRSRTVAMFGGLCAMVNGHMACGLFARSAIVRLGGPELGHALALDGATTFDPMGRGTPMRDVVLLPEATFDEPAELRAWLQNALDYTATLPPKPKGKKSGKKPVKKPKAAAPRKTARSPRAGSKPDRSRRRT